MGYKYIVHKNMVVCESSFAKRKVRGIAKCDPDHDQFVEQDGKDLAKARCDVKVCKKRVQRALAKHQEAQEMMRAAKLREIEVKDYLDDAIADLLDAKKTLDAIETRLRGS